MPTYAVGDVQGCHDPLLRLLDAVRFDPAADRLWFVGDLVNRGPRSVEVLRFVRGLGDRATTVLGNHDLHLIAVAAGHGRLHRRDTLQDVLDAPDRDELLAWLRARPLLHAEGGFVMVHAGLLPAWTVPRAAALAREVEAWLRGPDHAALCANMYGNEPDGWRDDLAGWERVRVIVNAMTRMRVCTPSGEMDHHYKGVATDIPAGYLAWFEVPGRANRGATVVCGHWSALGLRLEPGLIALDSGCVWGQGLTAIRLEDRRVFQVPCVESPGRANGQRPVRPRG